MDNCYEKPRLRQPLDLRVEQIDGKNLIILRCPLGIAPRPLCLIPEVAPLLARFNGANTTAAIAAELDSLGATEALVLELCRLLDEHLFLDTPAFSAAAETVRREFAAAAMRLPGLAGLSYPAEASELRALLKRYLAEGRRPHYPEPQRLVALIAPHIDYRRGGAAYGAAYGALAGADIDLFVILGVSHQYAGTYFQLTRKDFQSPLGVVPTAALPTERLIELYGEERSLKDELLHKEEHSLELQLPFLQQQAKQPRILPILVGGLHEILFAATGAAAAEPYESFIRSLTTVIKSELAAGTRIAFIAAVDLAHIGQSFGDPGRLSPQRLKEVELRDWELLTQLASGQPAAFLQQIIRDRDARRVCGFPVLYTLMDLLQRLDIRYQAESFAYQQAVDYDRDSAVSFAALGLYRQVPQT